MTTPTEERGLQTQQQGGLQRSSGPMQMPSGMAAVAMLNDDEFSRNLSMLKTAQERTRLIQQQLMTEGRDYGVVPGTKKPTLLKPGAETLTLAYGFVARIETDFIPGDGVKSPTIRVDATCAIHVGSWDGPIVAVGYGTCNSWETKYRYRTATSGFVCPGCGKPGLIKTRARPAEGRKPARPEQYWHPTDARPDGGCNANFPIDEPSLQGQKSTSEKVENPDPYDVMNTILKIAEKRSHVDAILRATGTSGLFTVEEEEADKKENPDAKSRREFNEWVAEVGLDPAEVMDVGHRIYPDRELKKLTVWERTAWRSVLERDLVYATPAQRAAAAEQAAQQPAEPQQPAQPAQQAQPEQAQPAAAAPQQAQIVDPDEPPPLGAPRNVTPVPPAQAASEREAIRADVKAGRSADEVAAGVRAREAQRQPVAPGGRLFSPDELADIGG